MGQKTHPNLLKLEKIKNWPSKYFEKKLVEYSIYSRKDLEIWSFIKKFFKNNGLILKTCKLCYLNNSLHVLISYYQNLDFVFFKSTQEEKKINFLKNIFFESFTQFIRKKWKLCLIFQKSTNHFRNKSFGKWRIKKLLFRLWRYKKVFVRLWRYKNTEFFNEAIHIMLICLTQKNSVSLLIYFITKHLKYHKNQNFFLSFVKNSFVIIKNSIKSPIKGIKLMIKGRLNGRPWARKTIIPIITHTYISSNGVNIDYAEGTVFTKNGTLGIKAWISEK